MFATRRLITTLGALTIAFVCYFFWTSQDGVQLAAFWQLELQLSFQV